MSSDAATRPMDTASRPSLSATRTPASTIRARLRVGFGPFCDRSRTPQAAATVAGIPASAAYDDLTCHFAGQAIHRDQASLTLGVPTDGSAAEVRALLDAADPGRTRLASFAVQTASLDDVFLILTHHDKETADV